MYSSGGRWDEVDYSQCFTNITLAFCEASLVSGYNSVHLLAI